MEEITKKINSIMQELKDYLILNINGWEPIETGQHCFSYTLEGVEFKVWVCNGVDFIEFYGEVNGVNMSHAVYTSEEKSKIQKKIDETMKDMPIIRDIEQTQLSNDLFFSFDGVHRKVKFNGYNDSDWWNKYKPLEIIEDEKIVWVIDWERMRAKYKKQ